MIFITMQRLCLLLLAIFTLSTANAIKKVDLDIKTLKELVGSADRNKMGEILEKSRIMDDGREVFEGFNAYDKMLMAYYCIFDDRGVLKSVMFPTKYATGYALEMIMVNKIKPYKKEEPDSRNLHTRHLYRWDGREIIIELEKGRVTIYKRQPDAH